MSGIAERLRAVEERIAGAARRAGRDPREVSLVAVSKRMPAQRVVEAVHAGVRRLGENYVQEAAAKIPAVHAALAPDAARPRWHFIGRLQRNKAGVAAGCFDCIETVDRAALGEALAKRAERPLDVLIQVDVSGEPQKGGVSPEALPNLLAASTAWTTLRVVGLMAIPAAAADAEASRPAFARLRALRDAQRAGPGGEALRELSMGMSSDFEVAIEEGATIIRVGTAIFGPRES